MVNNGLFVTESHYLLDLIDTVQYDSIYHEHLKYYSAKSIIKLFEYYNFTVIDIDRIPNYGGSIRVYARKGKSHDVSSKVTNLLKEEGARRVYACATHAVFSGPAISRLSSGVLEEVIVTNTIPIPEKNCFKQLTVLSVANLLGEAIWRVHEDTSVSSMFR